MAKDELPKYLKNRFDHVYWSIFLYNSSLTELQIVSDFTYNGSELKIVNSHTFDFYRVTLQYCFIMEYNKLLERGRSDNEQNISSLYKLNQAVFSEQGKSYENKYLDNENSLTTIKDSDYFAKIRNLRDKKFAHADNHEMNTPFSVKGFKTDDFENGFSHLMIIKGILNNLTSMFDFEYDLQIPYRDNRTENFIRFHAEYQDYYFKNFMKARMEKVNRESKDSR
jgi:hypothetical protein